MEIKPLGKKQMRKEFIKFLKENNALIPFLCNLAIGLWMSYSIDSDNRIRSKSLSELVKQRNAHDWIEYSFEWRCTTEGHPYWRTLSDAWITKVKTLIQARPLKYA